MRAGYHELSPEYFASTSSPDMKEADEAEGLELEDAEDFEVGILFSDFAISCSVSAINSFNSFCREVKSVLPGSDTSASST